MRINILEKKINYHSLLSFPLQKVLMKRSRIHLWIQYISILMLVLLLSCASGHEDALLQDTPQVRPIQEINDRLSKIVLSFPNLSIKTIGQITYGSFCASVQVVTLTPGEKPLYHILVVDGIHGNEPTGVEAVIDLIETVVKKPPKYRGVVFDFIPCVNPWGWAHDIRFNKNGRDINRDFASFKSQEAAIIRDFVKGKSYDLILDHHEDPKAKGFYLYQYDTPGQSLSRDVIKNVREAGYPIEQDINMILLKNQGRPDRRTEMGPVVHETYASAQHDQLL